MTVDKNLPEDVKIEIVTENFRNYSESYADFLKILWITINPTKVILIYPRGDEIFLESVKTYELFCNIVDRIERIYAETEPFLIF